MSFKKFFLIAFVALSIVSCGSDNINSDLKTAVSSFINANDKTVAFGSAEIKTILNKTDYQSNSKLAVLLGTEINKVNSVLDLETPVYFVAEGPLKEDGSPEAMHLFIKVKSMDSLRTELESRSFDLNKAGKIDYTEDGDFVLGIKDNVAIVSIIGGDYDAKKVVNDNFKMADGDVSGGSIDEILANESDLVFGVHLENLYATSNTDLQKLDKKTQQEIKDMMKASFVSTSFKFEEGSAVMETKNYFSDALKAKMFMNGDANAPIVKKLGKGNPRFGLSINMDVKKMQSFLDEFSPDATKELAKAMGGPAQMALMAAGSDGLSGLFTGKIGAYAFAEQDDFGTTTDFNFFVGLTSRGQALGEMAQEMLSYTMKEVKVDKDGLYGYTNLDNAPASSSKLKLPEGCENFGKSGISFFANLDGLDFDEFDLEGEENLIRVVKYVTFDYNNDGGKLVVKAKKGNENILKQALDVVLEELMSQIGNMAI